jgi:hypothetical protein
MTPGEEGESLDSTPGRKGNCWIQHGEEEEAVGFNTGEGRGTVGFNTGRRGKPSRFNTGGGTNVGLDTQGGGMGESDTGGRELVKVRPGVARLAQLLWAMPLLVWLLLVVP